MRIGLITSFVAHTSLIALGLVSLNNAKPHVVEEIETISVELVPIEDVANIRIGTEQSDVIETQAPALVDTPDPAQIAERTGNTEEDQIKPQQSDTVTPAPTIQTAPEPDSRPDSEPEPEPTPAPEPEPTPEPEPAPTPTPVPEPTPEPIVEDPVLTAEPEDESPKDITPTPIMRTASIDKKRQEYQRQQEAKAKKRAEELAAKKAKEAKEADRISDIINAEESRGATTGAGGQASAGKPTGQAARLTQSERNALAAAMRKCWSPPIGALAEDGLTVRLLVNLNRDGSVLGTPKIMSQINSSVAGATARAAQRAVARCSPYKLSADKYDEWKQVDVTFDPRDVL